MRLFPVRDSGLTTSGPRDLRTLPAILGALVLSLVNWLVAIVFEREAKA